MTMSLSIVNSIFKRHTNVNRAVKLKWKPLLTLFIISIFILYLLSKTYLQTNRTNLKLNTHENEVKMNAIKQSFYQVWNEPNGKYNLHDPGENGEGVETLQKDFPLKMKAYSQYGFNQFVSDKISLHRSLPDPRPTKCLKKEYAIDLPKVSVIVIFHNEGWSTLLRTMHSVLDRSPPSLLHEIVLCDDFSTKEHLKKKLEDYVSEYEKVKIVRTTQREGLIRARVYGADHASGEALLFLDSHCEANVGWLPPLLYEISKNYRAVVCPTVDFIDHGDFHYRGVDPYIRGTFNWRFDYKERVARDRPRRLNADETAGVMSPVMAGGLFAISRRFWEEIGKYDPGMYVWGGEQYEISFKLWMCHGQMMNMPCSRVGHVYRRNVPYSYDRPNAVLINFKRVAEVWMDGFKEFLYQKRLDVKNQIIGDISDRLEIRRRNKCHDFRWYLKNVANDTVRARYEPDRGVGQIRNVKHGLCLSNVHIAANKISLRECDGAWSQQYHWTYLNELRQDPEDCLDARFTDTESVYLEKCHEMGGNQKFTYNTNTKQFYHAGSSSCLSVNNKSNPPVSPSIEKCSDAKPEQKWEIKLMDVDAPIPEWAQIAEDFPHHPIP